MSPYPAKILSRKCCLLLTSAAFIHMPSRVHTYFIRKQTLDPDQTWSSLIWVNITGFPQALEIMENLEKSQKKSSMHGKIMEFEKKN